MQNKLFAWIIPTVKTPELVILQIVGLDAAVVRHLLALIDLPAHCIQSCSHFSKWPFFSSHLHLSSRYSSSCHLTLMYVPRPPTPASR